MIVALMDAGPLISLFDKSDPHFQRYNDMLLKSSVPLRLHSTWPCVVEASHILPPTYRMQMLKWVAIGGVQIFPFDATSLVDMTTWMMQYTESPRTEMDFADASLYWAAIETGVTTILTLDVRDFSRYRLPDGRGFEVI